MKKNIDVPLLFSLWQTDISNRDLAEKLGIAVSTLWDVRKRYGLPPRKYEHHSKIVDPTPEEIEKRCESIRRRWSKKEADTRTAKSNWSPPSYSSFDQKTMTFRA